MANIEKQNQTNNALAVRMQQAEAIKNAVACFIPETPEAQATFSKNCLFYAVKNKAVFNGDVITINGVNVDLFEYLQKMYLASKAGLSLIDGDFSFITYDGGEVVVVPDFRAEKCIAESKGLTIQFLHGREGDTFTQLPDPLQHEFNIKPKAGKFTNIKSKQGTSKSGKAYAINEVENDVVWYAAVAQVNDTNTIFSYVESTENILLRANPKTLKFYKDPNAKDSMCEKFVLRQLIKRLPSNLRGIDFDKWEGKFEDVDQETTTTANAPAEDTAAKPTRTTQPERLQLVKDSELWGKMVAAIKSGKVTNIAAIDKYYIISDNDRPDVLALLMEQESPETNGETEDAPKSPADLFKNNNNN